VSKRKHHKHGVSERTDASFRKESPIVKEANKPAETLRSTNDPLTTLPPTTGSPSQTAYYEAMVALAGTVLSIVLSFVAAYSIYSRQSQDELAVTIQKELEEINSAIGQLSAYDRTLRGLGGAHYMELLQRESWKDTPDEVFDEDIKTIQEKFDELNGKFKGNFRTPAFFLEVKFLIDNLLHKMCCEFPSYHALKTEQRMVEYHVEFVDVNFPACRSDFETWSHRFLLYHRESLHAFSRLDKIILAVVRTEEASLLRFADRLTESEEGSDLDALIRESLVERCADVEKYIAFFSNLNVLKTKVELAKKDIRYYQNFRRIHPSARTFVSIGFAAVFGMVIPLVLLARTTVPVVGRFLNQHALLVTGVCFFLFLIASIVLLWIDICPPITGR
jgi:hypothetical protein